MDGMPAFKRDFKVWVAPIRSRPASAISDRPVRHKATESWIDAPEHWQVFRKFDVDQDNHLDKASQRRTCSILKGYSILILSLIGIKV